MGKPSKPLQRFESVLSRITAFTAADGRSFAIVPTGEGHRTLAVRSTAFREWFSAQAFNAREEIPSHHAWSLICHHLESQSAADPDRRDILVGRRVDTRGSAPVPTKILLDLANPDGQFVEITAAGWRIATSSTVHFETSPSTRPLPAPAPTPAATLPNPLQMLRDLLHLEPAGPEWPLIVSWLLNALRPNSSCPILILRGPSGCGKSMAARFLRSLIDPAAATLTPVPLNARELATLARQSYVLAFDHISRLTPKLTDALCRLATGAGISYRERGHPEPVQLSVKRPIILTVTDAFVPPPDLAARALIVTLPGLTPESRRSEPELYVAFKEVFPQILGGLCDTVAAGLQPGALQPATHPTRHITSFHCGLAAAPLLNYSNEDIYLAFQIPDS